MVTCPVSQYHTARCSLFGNCEDRGRLPISNLLDDTGFFLLPMLKVISQYLLLLSWNKIFLLPIQTHREELFFLLKLCLALMSQVYQFLKKKFHCFSRKVKQWFDLQCTVIGEVNKLLLMTETCYNEHWTLSLLRSC